MCKLFPILSKSSTITLKNKLTIYKITIRSILSYAAPVWNNASRTHINKIQIVQNKCFRLAGNIPRARPIFIIHDELKEPFIKEFLETLKKKFMTQCAINPNPLIRGVNTL